MGMDTVKLDGKYFTAHTESGAEVKEGDLLLEFDMEKIKGEGYELSTPVIVTNSDEAGEVRVSEAGEVNPGDTVIRIV